MFLMLSLKADDREIHVAENKKQALLLIHQAMENRSPYSLILTDIQLPDAPNGQILKTIEEEAPDTAFFTLSADSSCNIQKKASTYGSLKFFKKPFQIERIKQAVSNQLDYVHRQEISKAAHGIDPATTLMQSYLKYLKSITVELQNDMSRKKLKTTLHRLQGSAVLYGMHTLSRKIIEISSNLKLKHVQMPQEKIQHAVVLAINTELNRSH